MEDLAADIQELQKLLESATGSRVKEILKCGIDKLEKAQRVADAASRVDAKENSLPEPLERKKIVQSERQYVTLSSFSWDQEGELVKIYISLEGASKDNVEADFQKQQVTVRVHDVGGKNLRFSVPKLNKAVVPSACSISVRPKRLVVTLKKEQRGHWMDLYFKEDKFSKPSVDKDDPMAGIMDLMKNMYTEGDDEMKRTIAKAWTESRSGKKSFDKMNLMDED